MGMGLGGWRALLGGCLAAAVVGGTPLHGQESSTAARQTVETMIAREQQASHDAVHYAYLSQERSERTKGHLWTEHMVESDWGTVRYLVAVDGKGLSAEEASAERARLLAETADADQYRRQESKNDDGERSQQMLQSLPRLFVFTVLAETPQQINIGYRPNPGFTPQTMEEHALHGMTGTLVVDRGTSRLRELEGRATNDVNLGFGPFATLKAGSNFSTSREPMEAAVWKTSRVRTAIQGRALLLKTIARQQEYVHSGFQRLPAALSLRQCVAIAER